MSYLVLARKHRPTSFADIVGQEHVVRTLSNAIKLDRVHHAFLFTGARGVGKTTTARVLARALNCEKGPTAEPCGVCAACTEIASGASPDVLEIDGASNNGVDNVRELRENVRYLPSRGRFRLYIIDEVHMLSTAAFNALLKTLEEPPPHVKFIFATTEPQKIPVTILSRCQRFDFRRVSVQQLVEHVRGIVAKEGVSLSPSALTTIVREAQGSVRDALSLLDQVLSFAGDRPDDAQVAQALGIVERETVFQLADAILARDGTRVLGLVADVDARGHDLADVAGLLVEHFRDVMVVKVSPDAPEAVLERSPGEIASLRAQAEGPSRPDLHRLFSGLVGIAEDVSRSSHPRVTFEMGLLRLLEIEPVASLSDVLARLDALAGGLPPGSGPGSRAAPGGSSSAPPRAAGGTSAPAARSGAGPRASAEGERRPAAPDPASARASGSASAAPAPAARGPAGLSEAAPAGRDPAGTLERAPSARGAAATSEPAAAAGATEPASRPRPAPGDDGTGTLAWARLVDRVRQARPALASVLEHARVLQFGPEGVELGFAAGTFYWESARDPDLRATVLPLLEAQLGQAVPLKLSALDAGDDQAPASLAAQQDEDRRRREREIDESARTHPAVKQALSVLGGEVTEVVPLVDLDAAAGERR